MYIADIETLANEAPFSVISSGTFKRMEASSGIVSSYWKKGLILMVKPLAVLLGSLILATSITLTPAFAADRPENTILVQGAGSIHAQPDSFRSSIGLETQANTMEKARRENADKMTLISNSIKSLGIPNLKLKTAWFNIYPLRDYEMTPNSKTNNNKIVGYRVTNQLSIQMECADPLKLADYAASVIDTSVKYGASNANDINFYLSKNNRSFDDAIKQAIEQARHNATTLSEGLGIKLAGVYSVETSGYQSPVQARGYAPEALMAKSADMPAPSSHLEPGDVEVNANVTVRYAFTN
jgi:uncharacterized protein